MEIILILRTEIVCFVFLVFLLLYSKLYSMANGVKFRRICHIAMYHVVFDAVTVYTVNTRKIADGWNFALHIVMYFFAIWFCCEVLCYILQKALPHVKSIRASLAVHIPVALYLLCSPLMKITYVQGRGTWYSQGTAVYLGYLLAVIYIFLSIVLLIVCAKRLSKTTIFAMLPACVIMFLSILLQIIYPELLLTGALITLITVGIFFNVENPAAYLRRRAYVDMDTGIKNRNCYDEEQKILNELYFGEKTVRDARIAAIVFDVNELKHTNDTYGHMEGDLLIRSVAANLSKNLSSAYNIYRTGGDEFIAIYLGREVTRMTEEIKRVKEGCSDYKDLKEPMSFAIGAATWEEEAFSSLTELISLADKRMYEQKNRGKHRP